VFRLVRRLPAISPNNFHLIFFKGHSMFQPLHLPSLAYVVRHMRGDDRREILPPLAAG
jgi:hypothetical protein